MPDVLGDFELRVNARFNNLIEQINRTIAPIEKRGINLQVRSSGGQLPLGRIGKDINDIDKSLAAANARVIAFGASVSIIAGVSSAIRKLVTDSISVEKALTDINVVLNTTTTGLAKFSDELFEIAKNTGSSFNDVATAAKEFSRQGLSVEQTLQRTSDAMILVRQTGLDAEKAVSGLTAAINTFGKEGLTTTDIVNRLANVDSHFAVSSKDLIEGLAKAGQSATDAGVDFNQFISLVTAIKQKTSIAGSDIGNALKTIFTRTQRSDTLDKLEDLGIAVRDTAGHTLPLVQILESLAKAQDTLTDSQKSFIDEAVAGGFQINKLKAALSDLSKENGIYNQSQKVAATTTNEAIDRNEALNKSLSALANKTAQNLTKISAGVGKDVFGPALKNVLGGINSLIDTSDSEKGGLKIGESIAKGIGNFIAGPGLILVSAVFGKLLARLAGDVLIGIKKILEFNKTLAQSGDAQKQVLGIENQRVAAANTLLDLIKQQNTSFQQQSVIVSKASVQNKSLPTTRISGGGGSIQKAAAPLSAFGPQPGGLNPSNLLNLNLAQAGISQLGANAPNPPPRFSSFTNRLKVSQSILQRDLFNQAARPNITSQDINDIINKNNKASSIRGLPTTTPLPPGRRPIQGTGEAFARASSVVNTDLFNNRDEINQNIADRNLSLKQRSITPISSKNQNRLFGAAFAAPIIGGAVGNVVGGRAGNAISGIGEGIGTGALVGSLAPNPIGITIGVLIASFKTANTIVNSLAKSFENLQQESDKVVDGQNKIIESLSNFETATGNLNQLLESGASNSKISNAARQQASALAKLPNNTIERITNATGPDEISEIIDELKKIAENTKGLESAKLNLTARADNNSVAGFGVRGLGKVDNFFNDTAIGNAFQKPARILFGEANTDLAGFARKNGAGQAKDRNGIAQDLLNSGIGSQITPESAKGLDKGLIGGGTKDIVDTFRKLKVDEDSIAQIVESLGELNPDEQIAAVRLFINAAKARNSIEIEAAKALARSTLSLKDFKEKTDKAFNASLGNRQVAQSRFNISTGNNLSLLGAANSANTPFINDIQKLKNSAQEGILGGKVTAQKTISGLQDQAIKAAQSFAGVRLIGNNEFEQRRVNNSLSKVGTSQNPIEALKQFQQVLGGIPKEQLEQGAQEKIDKNAELLAELVRQQNEALETSKAQEDTLKEIQKLQSLSVAIAKVGNNFRGVNALNSSQDLSAISAGRQTQGQALSERDNFRFQNNQRFELENPGNGQSREDILRRRRLQDLGRSDTIGRGLISGFESGAIPKEEDAFLLENGGDRRGAAQARALNSVNRSRLGNSFLGRRNEDITQQGSDIVSNLLDQLKKNQFGSGSDFTIGNDQEGLVKRLKDAIRSGDLGGAQKQLETLSKLAGNGTSAGVINQARQDLLGLSFQQRLAPAAAANNAAIVAGSSNGPLTNATFVRGIEDMVRAIRDQETKTEEFTRNKAESAKDADAVFKAIRDIPGLTNKEKATAEADQIKSVVQSNSEISHKVDVDLNGLGSNVTDQRFADFEVRLKDYITEYFKSGGNPRPAAATSSQ